MSELPYEIVSMNFHPQDEAVEIGFIPPGLSGPFGTAFTTIQFVTQNSRHRAMLADVRETICMLIDEGFLAVKSEENEESEEVDASEADLESS